MRLQILIPQYNEGEKIIKPLLDSIAFQRGVSFEDIGVLIFKDGGNEESILSQEFLDAYPFAIDYRLLSHAGVSATRNALLNESTADYVMYCDDDDVFMSALGLQIIMSEMANPFEAMISVFLEEVRLPDGRLMYVKHENDGTYVHGKVYSRSFLNGNKIRWCEELLIHEDNYFNAVALSVADEIRYVETPFYLWCNNPSSVTRSDRTFVFRTYADSIRSKGKLIDEFLRREDQHGAARSTAKMTFTAYYDLNKSGWYNNSEEINRYRIEATKEFKRFFQKYGDLFWQLDAYERAQIMHNTREFGFKDTCATERMTFNGWLDEVMSMEDKE